MKRILMASIILLSGCNWVDSTGVQHDDDIVTSPMETLGDEGADDTSTGSDQGASDPQSAVAFINAPIESYSGEKVIVRMQGFLINYDSDQRYHLCLAESYQRDAYSPSEHQRNYYLGTWGYEVDDVIEIVFETAGIYKLDFKRVDGVSGVGEREECVGYIANYDTHKIHISDR